MAEHYIKEEEFSKVQEHLKVLELDPEVKTISEDEYIQIGKDLLMKPELPCPIPIGEFRKVSFPLTDRNWNFDGFYWEYLLGGPNGAIFFISRDRWYLGHIFQNHWHLENELIIKSQIGNVADFVKLLVQPDLPNEADRIVKRKKILNKISEVDEMIKLLHKEEIRFLRDIGTICLENKKVISLIPHVEINSGREGTRNILANTKRSYGPGSISTCIGPAGKRIIQVHGETESTGVEFGGVDDISPPEMNIEDWLCEFETEDGPKIIIERERKSFEDYFFGYLSKEDFIGQVIHTPVLSCLLQPSIGAAGEYLRDIENFNLDLRKLILETQEKLKPFLKHTPK
jgi:hypothetical protein